MPLHATFLSGLPTSKLALRTPIGGASPLDNFATANATANSTRTNAYSGNCDRTCTTITLAVTLPVLCLLGLGGLVGYLWIRRMNKRDAAVEQRAKEDEERDIALRKLGPGGDWGSVSEGGTAVGEGSVSEVRSVVSEESVRGEEGRREVGEEGAEGEGEREREREV